MDDFDLCRVVELLLVASPTFRQSYQIWCVLVCVNVPATQKEAP